MSEPDGYRLDHIEATATEAATVARSLAGLVAVSGSQIIDLREEVGGLRAEVKDARAGVRTLVLVLVGFAFTVAGSAVALALTVGGPT